MSDSFSTPNATTSGDSERFESRFPFAALRFEGGDKRRKMATKFAQYSMPADIAAQAAAMYRANVDNPALPNLSERTNPRQDSLPVVPRLRVVVAMVEPNVLPLGRCHSLFIPKPSIDVTPEGVWEVQWDSMSDHEAATRGAHENYLRSHEVTTQLAHGESTLDTWHDPFMLVAVRHTYNDGTPTQARWMCANGNARLHGARIALATDLTDWGVEHPWTDPAAYWSADMAVVRTAVAAARTNIAATDMDALGWSRSTTMTEQWADFMVPAPERTRAVVDNWLFHEHNTKAREDEVAYPVREFLDEWLRGIDIFAGLDAVDITGIIGVDVATREGREEVSGYEEEGDKFLRAVSANKDRTATRITLAAAALAATPADDPTLAGVPVSGDSTGEAFTVSDWYRKGRMFSEYARRVTIETRDAHLSLVEDLNTVRQYLSETRTFPDGDLWGAFEDLDSPLSDDSALADPTTDWFTLTAMWGISYAMLYGHLRLHPLPTPLNKARRIHDLVAYEAAKVFVEQEGREFTDADEPEEKPRTSVELEEWDRSLLYNEAGSMLEWLVTSAQGQKIVVYYAQCAEQGDVPENRIQPIVRQMVSLLGELIERADAHDAAEDAADAAIVEPDGEDNTDGAVSS